MLHQGTRIITRAIRIAAVASALAIAATASAAAQAPSGQPIKLGLIAELSGPLGFYGKETERAAELVVKQINSAGGLLGRPVQLISRDSKTTVNEAVRQARDLLFTEQVDFLLHSINSGECVAVAEDIVGHRLPSRVGHASLAASGAGK